MYKNSTVSSNSHRQIGQPWSVSNILNVLSKISFQFHCGGSRFPVALFKILKDDAVVALNMSADLENSVVAIGLEKVSFPSCPKERQCQRMFKL